MVIKNLRIKSIILLFLYNLISLISYAQCNYAEYSDAPKELFRKRVKEPGMRYGNPYTMFVRDENFNLNTTLEQIRLNLTSKLPPTGSNDFPIYSYPDLYKGIFKMAKGGEPAKCPELQEVEDCMHPAWVKNNAIVYLIGLRYDTTALGKDTLILMDPAEKDIYFWRAHQGLRDLNPNVNSCTWGSIGECGKVRNKAQQLIFYLQAYDLLKAGEGLPIFDRDRNGGQCTARNKLRVFARNLYRQSNSIINSTAGWKKNHGIICASALGMAAIVLNDAGTENSLADFDAIIGSIGNFLWW